MRLKPSIGQVTSILYSGGVPNELSWLWKQPMPTLKEKVMLYRKQRLNEMMFNHKKFVDTLSEPFRENLLECITRMSLQMAPPNVIVGMDRQLFYFISDGEGGKRITALTPLARLSLEKSHGKQDMMTSLN